MYEFPAGGQDQFETPQIAAVREMEEETGYVSNNVTALAKIAPSPGKVTCWDYIFLALNAVPSGNKHNDENEQIRVILKTPNELRQLIQSGDFPVGNQIAAAFMALEKLKL